MMFWIISDILILSIVYLSLGNIYERNGYSLNSGWKRAKWQIWEYILITLVCIVPILNFFGLIALIIFLVTEIIDDDDYQLRGPIGKFIAWLAKEV